MLYNNGENVFQIWLTNATKGKDTATLHNINTLNSSG